VAASDKSKVQLENCFSQYEKCWEDYRNKDTPKEKSNLSIFQAINLILEKSSK
jgi:hypothetical protein